MNKENRPAGWKPDAPTDECPDPPPAPPRPLMAHCDNCNQWVSVVQSEKGGYIMPTHGHTGLAPTCIKAEVSIVDCYTKRPKGSDRIMEIAQQLTEESKSTDGLAKAMILEAVAKLCLASTLLDEQE